MTNSNRDQNQRVKSDFDILSNPHLKENPFGAPQGYFAQLEADIQEQIKANNIEIRTKKSIFSPQLQTAFSMAAMFIIILGLGYSVMYVTNNIPKDSTEQLALNINDYFIQEELTDEEISLYLGSDFNYENENIETTTTINIINIDKDALEDYIIDNYSSSTSILAALE